MKDFARYIEKIAMRCLLSPLKVMPIKKNRILLINDLSINYSCNLKAIAEYLIMHGEQKYEIVFTINDINVYDTLEKKGIKPIKKDSFMYFYYALTSSVLVTNSGGLSYVPLKKKQYVINTHHGGGAYKTAGIDMYEDSFFFRKDMELSAKQTSCFLSTNRKFSEVISKACLIPQSIFWEIGMPRNDRFLCRDLKTIQAIRGKLGLNSYQRLVLYAPTYRKPSDNYYLGSIAIDYHIDSKMVCEALQKRFGGEWIFAYRLHPCVENKKEYVVEDAIDLSTYDDMQDLLEVADVLINDFSSSFWDYMLTGKPCFMYAPDLQHYIETTQVYTPVEEWPFPKSTTNEELINSILSFDEDQYRIDCKKHYESLGGCETGRATQLVCERIMAKCTTDIN